MRPVCVKCRTEFRPETNGTLVIEMAVSEPYRVWEADLWKCNGCGTEIVVGFGVQPLQEHHAPGFSEWLTKETDTARRVVHVYAEPAQQEGAP